VRAWRERLNHDPVPPLLSGESEALTYFVRRDLLEESVGPVSRLWELPEAQKIGRRQQADGSWARRGELKHPAINYSLIETWKRFRFLVEMYGFTKESPLAEKTAEFLFSCQTDEGDIRGFLANQYCTYYTGAILSLLIGAGYEDDSRTEKGLDWLLSMRQNDGAWSVPMITHKLSRERQYELSSQHREPLQPDRAKPFSHSATGMVLRGFAAHSVLRQSEAARKAAQLLTTRFFQPDAYSSYRAASYWVKFQIPFWWNHLVAALDSVSLIGIPKEDENVARALDWLVENQQASGLWKTSYVEKDGKVQGHAGMKQMEGWITLAICRVFKRYYA